MNELEVTTTYGQTKTLYDWLIKNHCGSRWVDINDTWRDEALVIIEFPDAETKVTYILKFGL